MNAAFEGLMRIGPNGVEPGMADSYTQDSPTEYTFHIREGAKWSNGDPVTAYDFEYAWKRALDPKTASDYAYQLYYLKNGEKFNAGQASADDVGVKAVDEHTLKVTLETPTPYFLGLTAFPTLMPVDKNVVEKNDKWYTEASTLVGNGPFIIKEWVHNDHLLLEKNPNYWDAANVKIDGIKMVMVNDGNTAETMFNNGDLDENGTLTPADTAQLIQEGVAKTSPTVSTTFFRFNVKVKPLDDPRVREALTLAIDRQAIIDNVLKAGQKPAMALVPYGITDPVTGKDFREEGGDYFKDNDVERAKQLLAEAGYPDGKGFPKLTYLYNETDTNKALAEAYQQMWKQNLGIDVQLASEEWKVFLQDQKALNYQISRGNWVGDYLDPMTFIDMFVSGSGNNRTGWGDPEYDRLVAEAKATDDQKVRFENMRKAEDILMKNFVIGPIYFGVSVYEENPQLKGVFRTALGTVDYKWAYFEGE